MNIWNTLRGAIMKLLNLRDARALGCDMTPAMADAVRQWDELFYLTDQPQHSLKMAATLTSLMATLATSELTFSAGAGTRADWLQGQMDANLLPSLHEAVQLAGVGGMAAVKPYVAAIIGEEHMVPTLGVWDSPAEIDWDALPDRFVLKCTHDSGSTIICRDKASFDRDAACRRLIAGLRKDYYKPMREWAYKGVKPRVIAERYLEGEINDYKFFCFGGVPGFLYVASDRFNADEETKFDFFDMEWNHLDIRNGHPNAAVPPERPVCFEEMKRLAAELSKGIPQVRVDFYEVDGKALFGEYTFYHMGGFVPFDPDSADFMMGEMFKLPGK